MISRNGVVDGCLAKSQAVEAGWATARDRSYSAWIASCRRNQKCFVTARRLPCRADQPQASVAIVTLRVGMTC